jgi:hypothetical protein
MSERFTAGDGRIKLADQELCLQKRCEVVISLPEGIPLDSEGARKLRQKRTATSPLQRR